MSKYKKNILSKEQKELRRRILEISYISKLSHIGSCLSAVDCIYAIYSAKKENDIFVLSNGHSGIALYAVLELFGEITDKKITKSLFIHPDRNTKLGIHVSSGSLGQGLPIAVGMAIADKSRHVFCMISDGETTEGSVWEALSFAADQKINNLTVFVNANGWGAYSKMDSYKQIRKLLGFGLPVYPVDGHNVKQLTKIIQKKIHSFPKIIYAHTNSDQLPFLKKQNAHYIILSKEQYKMGVELFS